MGILLGAEFQVGSACTGAVGGEGAVVESSVTLGIHVPLGLNLWGFGLCQPWVCAMRDPPGQSSLRKAIPSSCPRLCFLLEDFPAESPQKSTLRGPIVFLLLLGPETGALPVVGEATGVPKVGFWVAQVCWDFCATPGVSSLQSCPSLGVWKGP